MRSVAKIEKPDVLADNEVKWLSEWLADKASSTKRYRYRHPDIKEALVQETGWKCVYCESKVGHNTPGDIEHKIPSSKQDQLHFTWTNLTVACTECNRRKNDFYDPAEPFIDPYTDDVEAMIIHLGPVSTWRLGDQRAEKAVRILELQSHERVPLVARKVEVIQSTCHLLERIAREPEGVLKSLLMAELKSMTEPTAEYSAMILALLRIKGVELD